MGGISRAEVLGIAKLAKLHLNDEEIESLQDQLGRIIDHFRAIEGIDTTDVPPLKHVLGNENAFREDSPATSLSQADALTNAPKSRDGFFEVPKVLDKT